MITEDYTTLWVCTDCLYAAEGFDEHELGSPPMDPRPLALLPENYGAGRLTTGLTADEHAEDCPSFIDGEWTGEGDCECETQSFTWSPCDGCGSALGGDRYALTYWTRA